MILPRYLAARCHVATELATAGLLLWAIAAAGCKTADPSEGRTFLLDTQVGTNLCYDLSSTLLTSSPSEAQVAAETSGFRGEQLMGFGDAIGSMTPAFFSANAAFDSGQVTPVEGGAIRLYTDRFYQPLNAALYQGNCDRYRNTTAAIASGLNKVTAVFGTLYRGGEIRAADVAGYQVGKTVTAQAFLSTTVDQKTASRFARNALFEIATDGSPLIDWLSVHPDEQEILLPPGSRFTVTNVATTQANGHPFYTVSMHHLTPSLATKRIPIDQPALASWDAAYTGNQIAAAAKRVGQALGPGTYAGLDGTAPCLFTVGTSAPGQVSLTLSDGGAVVEKLQITSTGPNATSSVGLSHDKIRPQASVIALATSGDAQVFELLLSEDLRWLGVTSTMMKTCIFSQPQTLHF